jgi:hypothetical protein
MTLAGDADRERAIVLLVPRGVHVSVDAGSAFGTRDIQLPDTGRSATRRACGSAPRARAGRCGSGRPSRRPAARGDHDLGCQQRVALGAEGDRVASPRRRRHAGQRSRPARRDDQAVDAAEVEARLQDRLGAAKLQRLRALLKELHKAL